MVPHQHHTAQSCVRHTVPCCHAVESAASSNSLGCARTHLRTRGRRALCAAKPLARRLAAGLQLLLSTSKLVLLLLPLPVLAGCAPSLICLLLRLLRRPSAGAPSAAPSAAAAAAASSASAAAPSAAVGAAFCSAEWSVEPSPDIPRCCCCCCITAWAVDRPATCSTRKTADANRVMNSTTRQRVLVNSRQGQQHMAGTVQLSRALVCGGHVCMPRHA